MSPWHAIEPTFFTVKLNFRSPPGCWTYQLRVTSSWQGLALVDPEGEMPTTCVAVSGLALFQVQFCDAPTSIPPVAQVLARSCHPSRMFVPQVMPPVFLMLK